jgi:hypothetical protein
MSDVPMISSANNTTPTVGVALDGDTLMTYCAAQTNDLNGDIATKLQNQEKMRDVKSRLADLKMEIGANGGHFTREQAQQILTTFATLIRDVPPGTNASDLMDALQSFRFEAVYGKGKDSPGPPNIDGYLATGIGQDLDVLERNQSPELSADTAKKIDDKLGAVSDDVGKNADLDMMSLQDLVAKRQVAIQTTSQILAKFAQGYETIANNIK